MDVRPAFFPPAEWHRKSSRSGKQDEGNREQRAGALASCVIPWAWHPAHRDRIARVGIRFVRAGVQTAKQGWNRWPPLSAHGL